MKINDIYESTTSGSIATVATPMSTQQRSNVGKGVYGNEKAGNLLTGKKTNKKYANSVNESEDKAFKQGRNHGLKGIDNNKYINVRGKEKENKAYIAGRKEGMKLKQAGKTVNEGAMVDNLFKAKYKNRETGETKEVNIRATSSAEAREQAESHYTHNKSDWKCVSVKQVADEGRIVRESKMKQLAMDLETMQDGNFKQKYKKTKEHIKMLLGDPNSKKNVQEADLQEDDLIIIPGQGRSRKTGFIKHGESRLDHEVEMARSDLFSAAKNAKQVYELIADVSEEEGLEGWVQEKIIKANDYLNTIREYLEGKQLQNEMTGGVIAGGGVGEGIVDKIKGAVRREKAKDMPLVQTRRDYAMGKGGDAYNKGETRKGNQYMAYAEKDRKKKGDPTTNPAGEYRTKTSDYTNEGKYGKGMRDCCDSPAQKNQPHIKGCKNYTLTSRDRHDEMERHNKETIPGYKG